MAKIFQIFAMVLVPLLGNHSDGQAGMIDESSLAPWETCGLCHSLDGNSAMAKFPRLAGQTTSYIEKQLRDFRQGKRDNDGGQMQEMASQLEEKSIRLVAQHFSRQKIKQPNPNAPVGKRFKLGKRLVTEGDASRGVPACLSCHHGDVTSVTGAPRLESQHRSYLIKQVHEFKNGTRTNDPGTVMANVAKKLTSKDIEAVADYFAAHPRN